MRILVTGGAGFIGSNLCRHLTEQGRADEVIVLDDLTTGRRSNLEGCPVTLIEASINDLDRLIEVTTGVDAVVHLAARGSVPRSIADPTATHRVNATGTLNVLEACRRQGVRHVVVAGSSSVYGPAPATERVEGMTSQPVSPYAASKLATEAYALAYQATYGLPVLVLRFFNVFGPRQRFDVDYPAVVPSFVSRALRGEVLTVQGDGEQSRDFTYVDSVVRVIEDAVRRQVAHDTAVNLGFGRSVSVLQIVDTLREVLGAPVALTHVDGRPGDVRTSKASTALMREIFPAVPRPPSLQEALDVTVEWMRAELRVATR